jgi:hypothetical protein
MRADRKIESALLIFSEPKRSVFLIECGFCYKNIFMKFRERFL